MMVAATLALSSPPWLARNDSVVVAECTANSPSQRWRADFSSSGQSTLALGSNLSLCATLHGTCPDLPPPAVGIVLQPCASAGDAAQWSYDKDTQLMTSVAQPKLCMDAGVYPDENGTNVLGYPCDGRENQLWRLDASEPPFYTLTTTTSSHTAPICLTGREHAPPPPPPPPGLLFGPHDADVDGVCAAGGGCPCWRIPSLLRVPTLCPCVS